MREVLVTAGAGIRMAITEALTAVPLADGS